MDIEENKKNKTWIIVFYFLLIVLCFPLALIVGVFHLCYKLSNAQNKIEQATPVVLNLKNFVMPHNLKSLFSEDESSEIEYFMKERNYFENDYDIKDEWYQDFFKKAKKNNFETVLTDSNFKYSILKKGKKHYFASLSGCSCKNFPEDGFCEHMIINAINNHIIDPINGVLLNNEDLKEQLDFIYENIINSPDNILNIETGFIKKDKISNFFLDKAYIEVTYGIEKLIYLLSMKDIRLLIPDLKEKLKEIDNNLKISFLTLENLRKIIIENKKIFKKYFDEYVFVEIKEDIENKIDDCSELVEWIIYTQKKYQ